MAQNLFSNDPAQLAENRSTAKDMAWEAALNSGSKSSTNGAVNQQKALDFNAWTPPQAPQIPIIQPPVAMPEPEPAPEQQSLEEMFAQFGLNPDGTMKPPTNEWGDSFYASNEPPQGKPTGSLRDTVQRSGVGQAIGGGIGLLAGGPIGAAALGGTLGGIGGALSGGGAFGSGKGESQRQRDAWRREMQNLGFIDENYQIKLPNGTYFDMGKDGGARLANGLRYYETDTSNPVTEHVIEMMRPMATVLTAGDDKLAGDITAYLTNAVMQNGGTYEAAREAAIAFYRQLGIRKVETVIDELQQLRASGAISEEEFTRLEGSAQSLGARNKQEAINRINQQLQQAAQAQAQQPVPGEEQAKAAEEANRSTPQDYLQKNMQMLQANKAQQQASPGENRGQSGFSGGASGMQLVSLLQAIRNRQQPGGEQQQTQNRPVQTYSNPRLK